MTDVDSSSSCAIFSFLDANKVPMIVFRSSQISRESGEVYLGHPTGVKIEEAEHDLTFPYPPLRVIAIRRCLLSNRISLLAILQDDTNFLSSSINNSSIQNCVRMHPSTLSQSHLNISLENSSKKFLKFSKFFHCGLKKQGEHPRSQIQIGKKLEWQKTRMNVIFHGKKIKTSQKRSILLLFS